MRFLASACLFSLSWRPKRPPLDPATSIGAVCLRVADLDAARGFYERAIGLQALEEGPGRALMGVEGRGLVELRGAPGAPPRPPRSTGLFHLAILVGDRAALGATLRRLAAADWRLTGASDHLVSEALYTQDPEGNGIEIYRDRDRADWPREDGRPRMDTLPLDLPSILAEAPPGGEPMGPSATMGHVHLNVAGIEDSEAFYSGLLGFDVTVRGYPGALFVAAGGYHHHLGLNTWAGAGAPPPPEGSRGLERFEILVPPPELDALAARLDAAAVPFAREDGGLKVADPSSNGVLIRGI